MSEVGVAGYVLTVDLMHYFLCIYHVAVNFNCLINILYGNDGVVVLIQ